VSEECAQCKHPFDPHCLVATTDNDPMKGGIIVCPEKDCDCFATWSPSKVAADSIRIPDRVELEEIREAIR
jgi:hypothetical protein